MDVRWQETKKKTKAFLFFFVHNVIVTLEMQTRGAAVLQLQGIYTSPFVGDFDAVFGVILSEEITFQRCAQI